MQRAAPSDGHKKTYRGYNKGLPQSGIHLDLQTPDFCGSIERRVPPPRTFSHAAAGTTTRNAEWLIDRATLFPALPTTFTANVSGYSPDRVTPPYFYSMERRLAIVI